MRGARRVARRTMTSTASPLDKLAPAGSRPITSRHFEIDLRARGRSASGRRLFHSVCSSFVHSWIRHRQRRGAPAGSERDAAERVGGRAGRDDVWCRLQQRVGVLLCVRARRRAPLLLESRIRGIPGGRADILRPPPRPSRSADVSAHALLPIRRARLVRGPMGSHLGMHGQEEEARSRFPSRLPRLRSLSSPTTRLARARSDTSRPLHARFARRNGEALSAKARVPVENAPERGKPYWTLLDPREADDCGEEPWR